MRNLLKIICKFFNFHPCTGTLIKYELSATLQIIEHEAHLYLETDDGHFH